MLLSVSLRTSVFAKRVLVVLSESLRTSTLTGGVADLSAQQVAVVTVSSHTESRGHGNLRRWASLMPRLMLPSPIAPRSAKPSNG